MAEPSGQTVHRVGLTADGDAECEQAKAECTRLRDEIEALRALAGRLADDVTRAYQILHAMEAARAAKAEPLSRRTVARPPRRRVNP
jgi:hypothetical protein